MRRRLARLRQAIRNPKKPETNWASWVVIGYAEPWGTPRFGVWGRFIDGPDSPILGRGRTIRAAVRDAEKAIARGEWPPKEEPNVGL